VNTTLWLGDQMPEAGVEYPTTVVRLGREPHQEAATTPMVTGCGTFDSGPGAVPPCGPGAPGL
jgi:hypothetical protein